LDKLRGGELLNTIDYNVINTPLTFCYNKTVQKLDNLQFGQNVLVSISKMFLLATNNNYKAIRSLIVKDYKFSAAANVIVRSSMDMVFTLILMFCKPDKYVVMYEKSGWREKFEHLQIEKESEYMQIHGTNWLTEFEEFVEALKEQIGITEEELENLKKELNYFPTAPQILNKRFNYHKDLDKHTNELLEVLLGSFYHPLSQISHVTNSGLARHVACLLKEFSEENQSIIKSQPVFTSMMCMVIIMSEICLFFETNINIKLKEVWTYLGLTVPLQEDVYNAKYKSKL